MFEFIQGSRSYAQPTSEFEALLAKPGLDHGGNPVLAWMASNMKFTRDKNDNKMPNKLRSTGRIDGMTALIMAIGRWLDDGQQGGSIYDDPALWEKR
jgi:phage terminase large subunit-like protein